MIRTEETLTAKEVIRLVMDELEQRNLLNREHILREKILRKKWITLKEIADSNIWDVKSKSGAERIVKEEIDQDCIDKTKSPHRIHRSEVERIAKNRGIL